MSTNGALVGLRVLEIADYVYILHKGSIAFVGEPSQCRGSVFEQYMGGAA